MCRKTVIDVVDYDKGDKSRKGEEQKKALEDLRHRLMMRQTEINDALDAIKGKLGY
jgi:hypothetical protein